MAGWNCRLVEYNGEAKELSWSSIEAYARTLKDAVEAVQRWGYTLAAPPGYELVKKG